MLNEILFTEVIKEAAEQLTRGGAFLTANYGDKINTMTISWAAMGQIWNKPVLIVLVRYSRHTYRLIDKSGQFVVSFPAPGQLGRELTLCGTKSGRNVDKFKECGFKPLEAATVNAPLIDKCKIHIECKVVYKQAMEPGLLDKNLKKMFYEANDDYHVIYYGEVTSCHVAE
ncbi:MAG: flavin reductase family protein [Clostridia bacterium]|nr:flavin reductase family protein [Clostridia bacterium]